MILRYSQLLVFLSIVLFTACVKQTDISSLSENKKAISYLKHYSLYEFDSIEELEKKDKYFRIINDFNKDIKYYEKMINYKINDDYMFIKIYFFGKNLAKKLKKILVNNPSKNLVIDLKDNSGGDYKEAIKCVDLFIDKGIIANETDKIGFIKKYRADEEIFEYKNIKILVNKNTASSSELFAGSMQHNKKAKIAGTKTFGKNLIQTKYKLNENETILFTTRKYFFKEEELKKEFYIYPHLSF